MDHSLSIIIPSHNRPDLLRACLDTVTRHAPAGTEIVVVDDGSPGQAVSRVAGDFPDVRVVRLRRRRGFCVAANTGVRASSGTIIELLNDDTEVTPDWADAALIAFHDPKVGAVAPLVLRLADGRSQLPRIDSAGDRYYVGGIAAKRGHGELLSAAYLLPGRVFGASGSSAFYRRQALLAVGGFPESFGAYFEDVDVAFRLHRAGYDVHFQPESRVFHDCGGSYGRPQRRLLEQQSLNEERVYWRNLPGPDLIRSLPRHLAVLVAKAGRRWQAGELSPFLCGRLRMLAEVGHIFRHRRRLLALGPGSDAENWQVEPEYWA